MPQTISQQLDEVFHKASASFVRNMLKSDRDMAEFEAITKVADEKQEELTRLYHEQYDARVDAVRRRLYDEAAQVQLDHPAPPGVPTNDDGSIIRQAQREVEMGHEADLQHTDDEAQQAFEDLLDRAHSRNQTKGMATDAFPRARDRRSGEDRRTLKHSQD